MAQAARQQRLKRRHQRFDHRLPAHKRGYDHQWARLRAIKLQDQPLCEYCLEYERVTVATEVDHVTPFHGKDDPLRLDYDNLRSTCRKCHAEKTWREQRGSDGPSVCVVSGVPGSGKTTYAQQNMSDDALLFDLDAIAASLNPAFGNYSDRPADVASLVLGFRDNLVARLRSGRIERDVWIIIADERKAEAIAERVAGRHVHL